MRFIKHINGGFLQKEVNGFKILCHCLLLGNDNGLILIDTGIGMQDVLNPIERIGKVAIEQAGFKFNAQDTILAQIEKLGFKGDQVKHCVVSHLDPDHIGGLADFPLSEVHISAKEYEDFLNGENRYRGIQLAHDPILRTYDQFPDNWFGLDAKKLSIDSAFDIYMVPLPGHTLGHCGIAVKQDTKWILYVGDAYYLKAELFTDNHPVSALAEMMAMDNELRIASLKRLKELALHHNKEIDMFGYHDPTEFVS